MDAFHIATMSTNNSGMKIKYNWKKDLKQICLWNIFVPPGSLLFLKHFPELCPIWYGVLHKNFLKTLTLYSLLTCFIGMHWYCLQKYLKITSPQSIKYGPDHRLVKMLHYFNILICLNTKILSTLIFNFNAC